MSIDCSASKGNVPQLSCFALIPERRLLAATEVAAVAFVRSELLHMASESLARRTDAGTAGRRSLWQNTFLYLPYLTPPRVPMLPFELGRPVHEIQLKVNISLAVHQHA